MKFDQLRAVAHNLADSFASGYSISFGCFEHHVFVDASRTQPFFVEVDFMRGTSSGTPVSSHLARVITIFHKGLPSFLSKNGAALDEYRELVVRFEPTWLNNRFTVMIADRNGKLAVDEYAGTPGSRVCVLDHLGRRRPQPSFVAEPDA